MIYGVRLSKLFCVNLFCFLSLFSFPMLAEQENGILYINEVEILQSFPDYKTQVEKQKVLMQQYQEAQQKLEKFSASAVHTLQNMEKDIKAASKKDLAGSAQKIQVFETKRKELNASAEKIKLELIKIQEQIGKSRKTLENWRQRNVKNYVDAMKKVVSSSIVPVNMVIAMPGNEIRYINPALDRTKQFGAEFHKLVDAKM